MPSFKNKFSDVIQNFVDAFSDNTTFNNPVVGPTQFKNLEYPTVHILPDRSDYQGSGEYEDRINVFYYFERGKDESKYISHLEDVEATIDSILTELKNNDNVLGWKLQNKEDYAGNLDGSLIIGIRLEFSVTRLVDLAT